jgi:hypothetical protein
MASNEEQIELIKIKISNTILEVDKRILLDIPYFKNLFDEKWKDFGSKTTKTVDFVASPQNLKHEDILDIDHKDITLLAFMYIIDKYNGKDVEFSNKFIPTFEFLGIEYKECIEVKEMIDILKMNSEFFTEFSEQYKKFPENKILQIIIKLNKYNIKFSQNFISLASENDHLNVIRYLYEACHHDLILNGNWAIQIASKNGYLEIVRYLYETCHCDPKADNNVAIRWASENDHLDVVKYLFETCHCDPKADNNYAIKSASENGHLDIVRYLYETCNCDPKANDNYAINFASENNHLDVVKYLYETCYCDPKDTGNWAIQWASQKGHLDVVKYLESIGCDLRKNPN